MNEKMSEVATKRYRCSNCCYATDEASEMGDATTCVECARAARGVE